MYTNTIHILRHHDLLSTQDINNFLLKIDQQPIYKRRKLLNLKSQNEPYPHFIYKFLPLTPDKTKDVEHLSNYLVESRLWLSSPASFNDPFGMRCRYIFEGKSLDKRKHLDNRFKMLDPNLPKKEREKIISNSLTSKQPLTETLENIHEQHIKENGVCCFSEDTRNFLMWSHYGSNHTGISLQFQIAQDMLIFTHANKVKYSDEYPVIDYLKNNDLNKAMAQTLFHKSGDWAYEEERRIIHPNGANSYLQFNPCALTALILGCEFKATNVIKTLLNERMQKNYPSIRIFRAIRDKTRYSIYLQRQRDWTGSH